MKVPAQSRVLTNLISVMSGNKRKTMREREREREREKGRERVRERLGVRNPAVTDPSRKTRQ